MQLDSAILRQLWDAFIEVKGQVLALISFVASIAFYLFAEPGMRGIVIATVVGVTAIAIVILTLWAALMSTMKAARCPQVVYSSSAPLPYESESFLLVTTPSGIFFKNAPVAVYFCEDDIETLIGLGRVADRQTNGRIQIIAAPIGDDRSVWGHIATANTGTLQRLLVRPEIPDLARELLQ